MSKSNTRPLNPQESHLAKIFGLSPNKKITLKIGGQNVSLDFPSKNSKPIKSSYRPKYTSNQFPNTTPHNNDKSSNKNFLKNLKEEVARSIYANPIDEDISQTQVSQEFSLSNQHKLKKNEDNNNISANSIKPIKSSTPLKIPKSPNKPKLLTIKSIISPKSKINSNNSSKNISNNNSNNISIDSYSSSNTTLDVDIDINEIIVIPSNPNYRNTPPNVDSNINSNSLDFKRQTSKPNIDISTPYEFNVSMSNDFILKSNTPFQQSQIVLPFSHSDSQFFDDSSPCIYHTIQTQKKDEKSQHTLIDNNNNILKRSDSLIFNTETVSQELTPPPSCGQPY